MPRINATRENRRTLWEHAHEALEDFSQMMTWLLLDSSGDLRILEEVVGQTVYTGSDTVIATTGGLYKAFGNGAATDEEGRRYRTEADYLIDLLGVDEYARIFTISKNKRRTRA